MPITPSYTLRTPPKHNGYLRQTEAEIQEHLEFRHVMQRNILHDFVVSLTDPDAVHSLLKAGGIERLCADAEHLLAEVSRYDQ
jgi:poly(3-hydroxyalkanoate) synthetase